MKTRTMGTLHSCRILVAQSSRLQKLVLVHQLSRNSLERRHQLQRLKHFRWSLNRAHQSLRVYLPVVSKRRIMRTHLKSVSPWFSESFLAWQRGLSNQLLSRCIWALLAMLGSILTGPTHPFQSPAHFSMNFDQEIRQMKNWKAYFLRGYLFRQGAFTSFACFTRSGHSDWSSNPVPLSQSFPTNRATRKLSSVALPGLNGSIKIPGVSLLCASTSCRIS